MDIESIIMPKWGLAMEEGALTKWAVAVGQKISKGQEIADIETTKIANVFESPASGVIRRLVAPEGATLPVGALLAVVADASVSESEVDAYIEKFQAAFTATVKASAGGPVAKNVQAGGLSVRTMSVGDGAGTPVLLVHGFGSDLMSWLFTQEALAQGRSVHAFDLPGHGGTTKAIGAGGLPDLAAATLAVMDALGLGRAHLVGHSLGGAISAYLALQIPERIASASLIAPAGLGTEINMGFIEGFIGENRSRKLKAVLQELVGDPDLITADMVEDVLRFKRLDGAEAALRLIAEANFGGGVQKLVLKSELANARVPIGVIFGEEDRVIPARHAEGLPAFIPVTRVAGAGHLVHMEKSARVNEAIAANMARAGEDFARTNAVTTSAEKQSSLSAC
jgi:pyruvate dehydrogenase E2 component (dihydrolipoamide acetyltransferase)